MGCVCILMLRLLGCVQTFVNFSVRVCVCVCVVTVHGRMEQGCIVTLSSATVTASRCYKH